MRIDLEHVSQRDVDIAAVCVTGDLRLFNAHV